MLSNKYYMYHAANDIEFQTSGRLENISAEYGQDDEKFDGGEFLVTSRYQAWPEYLARHSNIKVLLNHSVVEVNSKNQNESTVKCANGKRFTTRKVVIAVPLGALKR